MVDFVWNQRVAAYKVDVFRASTLNYDRAIRLELENGHTVSIEFPASAPSDNLSLGTSFHTVKLPAGQYDELLHLLQTEAPVFFTAYETGSPAIRFAGLSTSDESVGEGLVDADALVV